MNISQDDCKALLHFDGNDGSTTITDETGKSWTAHGTAQIDTAQSVFGGASLLLDGDSDYVSTGDHDDFNVGSGDFILDSRIRPASTSAGQHLIVYQPGSGGYSWINLFRLGTDLLLYMSSNLSSWNIANGVNLGTVASNNWYHWGISRHGNNLGYFFQGSKIGTISVSGITFPDCTGNFIIGSSGSASYFDGWIDEFRFSKGVWVDAFDVPNEEYSFGAASACYLHSRGRDRFNMKGVSTQNSLA